MKIETVKNKKIWDDFFNENGSGSFLQSWSWGEFQQKLGYDINRLGIYKKNNLLAIAQVIKIKAKRGDFLFIPHGPIFNLKINKAQEIKSLTNQLIDYLIPKAKSENFAFIRLAPILENIPENEKIFSDLGFKTAPIYMHAETVWVLPLFKTPTQPSLTNKIIYKSEEELLASMRKTTRYLIKKAIREEVSIERRTDNKAVDDFYGIYEETARRENFVPFSKKYIEEEFKAFNKTGDALFLFAKLNKTNLTDFKPPIENIDNYLASALIIFTQSTAFYHQAASLHSKIPATYLLQWEVIKEAKRRGCQFYNFWGIYEEKSKRMPKSWQGLTFFKTGFGGHSINYLPTQDYIISPKYYLTYLWEKFLYWKRGV